MESLNCLLTIHISVLEKGAKATKDSVKGLKKADEEDVKTTEKGLGTPVKKEEDSVKGLKKADEEDVKTTEKGLGTPVKKEEDSVKGLKQADEKDVKTTDKDLGTPVEKEMATSATDLVVPPENQRGGEASAESPTSSQLEPGKYIN